MWVKKKQFFNSKKDKRKSKHRKSSVLRSWIPQSWPRFDKMAHFLFLILHCFVFFFWKQKEKDIVVKRASFGFKYYAWLFLQWRCKSPVRKSDSEQANRRDIVLQHVIAHLSSYIEIQFLISVTEGTTFATPTWRFYLQVHNLSG